MLDDQMHTFSDFSQDAAAVGGRLEFIRKTLEGDEKKFHGGFFSASLNNNQKNGSLVRQNALALNLFSSILDQF